MERERANGEIQTVTDVFGVFDFGEALAIHFVDDLRHANHIPG